MEDPEQKKKESEAANEDQPAPEPKAEEHKKKRYVKPSFQHERVFETNALACGKVGMTQETCRNNRKAS